MIKRICAFFIIIIAYSNLALLNAVMIDVRSPTFVKQKIEQTVFPIFNQINKKFSEAELVNKVTEAKLAAQNIMSYHGYHNAQITAKIKKLHKGYSFIINVDKKTPTVINSIDINFIGEINQDLEEKKRVLGQSLLEVDNVFRQDDWQSTKNGMLNVLYDAYPTAQIEKSRVNINKKTHTAQIFLTINSGPSFYYEGLIIKGNNRYQKSIVEKLNLFTKDERITLSKINLYVKSLLETPYYKNADIKIAQLDQLLEDGLLSGKKHFSKLRVNLIEEKNQKFNLGLSLSSDKGVGMIFGFRKNNITSYNQVLNYKSEFYERERRVDLAYSFPPQKSGTVTRLGFNYFLNFTESLELSINNRRRIDLFEFNYGISFDYDTKNEVQALSPKLRASYTSVDDAFFSQKGFYSYVDFSFANNKLFSTTTYFRSLYGLQIFVPISYGKRQLIFDNKVGYINAQGEVNENIQFAIGGSKSLRGFNYNEIKDENNNPGNSFYTISATYVDWLNDLFGLSIFYDIGSVSKSFDRLQNKKANTGYGLGGRIRTNLGVFSLDFGYREKSKNPVIHFFLNVVY